MNYAAANLLAFQTESNHIEGIDAVLDEEVQALERLLDSSKLWIGELVAYVSVCQPSAVLRDKKSVPGVRVGDHIAPPSGPKLMEDLCILLDKVNNFGKISSWRAHVEYENLHPFTDGNGRSGRALWLWMCNGQAPLGFLHSFYYQTLSNIRLKEMSGG
jgi:Fic/DOC family